MRKANADQTGIICLVPDRWGGVFMPRHQVLTRLARRWPVVWLDMPAGWRDYWLPGGRRFLEGRRQFSPYPGFTVLTPGMMRPAIEHPAWLRRALLAARLADARQCLSRAGVQRIVLYLWRYAFAEALELCPHDVSCYHIDDEYSFSDVDLPNDPQEVAVIRRVDQVIVHSTALLRKKGGLNPNTAMIPNGVDFGAFSRPSLVPADLASVPRPRIGYIGVIKRQLDLARIVRIARSKPGWSFVLVGPIGNVSGQETSVAELRALRNVHFLGVKTLDELPAYTQHMDVCLMCYAMTDYTKYIYPLKLHEYLAAGRPTVSSPIDTVREHADVVTLAHSDEDWVSGIEGALEAPASTEAAAERRRMRARQYDWETLTDRVAELFRERMSSPARRLDVADGTTAVDCVRDGTSVSEGR
jgi:glycosyltransferase involved in cell wall biosynthesis